MAKVVTAITATVAGIGRARPSTRNPGTVYHPVCFMPDGGVSDEDKIWKNLGPEEIAPLTRGAQVQLIPTTGNSHNIVLMNQPTPAPEGIAPPSPASQVPSAAPGPKPLMDKQQQIAIASYVDSMGDLYSHCYSVACTKLPEAPEAAIQAMASSLFIAAQRRFSLA